MISRAVSRPLLAALCLCSSAALAAPQAQPGDMALRHDLQVLADYGAFSGPVTTWPIAWDAILHGLEKVRSDDVVLPNRVLPTFERVLARAQRESARGKVSFTAGVGIAEKPVNIRGFSNTPREDGEVRAGVSWFSDLVSLELSVAGVDNPADGDDFRADGSPVGIDLGNWSIAASTLDRWWGPGWDGSLILSNNARPIPSLSIGRNLNTAPTQDWLRWVGPWDLQVLFGQLESERAIPNARFFGMRFNFRPLKGLEIGISRTAIWCGDGRPCDWGTFWDLMIGDSNPEDFATVDEQPGNQLAGFDVRWTNFWFETPVSVYAQAIGEDEAGGFPSRYLTQIGIEGSGITRGQTSYRWFIEGAETSCGGLYDDEVFNCAYLHDLYTSGYTYNGRVIGHGLDNDARVVSGGFLLVFADGNSWELVGRVGELNRVGPQGSHTVAAVPQDLASVDIRYSFNSKFGTFDLGAGFERREEKVSGIEASDTRGFLQWRYDWGH